jgi:hypothetical protein
MRRDPFIGLLWVLCYLVSAADQRDNKHERTNLVNTPLGCVDSVDEALLLNRHAAIAPVRLACTSMNSLAGLVHPICRVNLDSVLVGRNVQPTFGSSQLQSFVLLTCPKETYRMPDFSP